MEQFLEVAIKVCPKSSEETALLIGEKIWKQQRDIRDVISVSKLVKKDRLDYQQFGQIWRVRWDADLLSDIISDYLDDVAAENTITKQLLLAKLGINDCKNRLQERPKLDVPIEVVD